MNNRIQSLTGVLLYTAIAISLTSVISGCSLVSKKQDLVVEKKTSDQWYECARNKNGSGWDCGSISNSANTEFRGSVPEKQPAAAVSPADQASNEQDQKSADIEAAESSAKEQVFNEKSAETESGAAMPTESSPPIYTIQVGAFAGETRRDNFVEDNGLQAVSLSFYESIKDGRTWWVLTYGEFSDIDDAKAAGDELGDSYGLSDIWIRPLEQLRPESRKEFSQNKTVKRSGSEISENPKTPKPVEENENFYDPHYSIQLAAFKTEQKRDQFVTDKGLSELELIYVREGRLGETWWIALFGEFEFVKDAKVKQAEIEAEFGLSGTWIKPVESR